MASRLILLGLMAEEDTTGISLIRGATAFSKGHSTASVQPERRARIWNIGELGGGVSYFGEDNLLGIYSLLKDRISQGLAPDLIVFRQVLPEVPKYETKSYRARNLLIAENVDDLDQAVVMMKPHLSRIIDLIQKSSANTKIVYVWGYNDEQNEKVEYEALGEAFNHNPKHLARMRMNYAQAVSDLGSKIDNIDIEVRQLAKELDIVQKKVASMKGATGRAAKKLAASALKLPAKISYLEKKKEQLLDELSDNLQIKDLYTKLLEMWISGRDADTVFDTLGEEYIDWELSKLIKPEEGPTIQELREQTQKDFDRVKKQIEESNGKRGEKSADLEKRARELANKLTKLSHIMIAEEKSKAERATEERLSRERRFTGLEAGKPSQTKIESRLSRLIIESSIKDAFGRRMPMEITSGNRSCVYVNGLKVVAGTKGDNTSPYFVKDSSYRVRHLLRTIDSDADVLLLSGSPRGIYEPLPKANRSEEICFTDVAPPCINVQKLMEEHMKGRKTWFTEMLTKGLPASGFNEIEIDADRGSATHSFISSKKLEIFADREKAAQARILAKMVGASWSFNRTRDPLDARDMLQLRHKLPSEITEKGKFARLLDDFGVNRKSVQARTWLASMILKQKFDSQNGEHSDITKWLESKLRPSGMNPEISRISFLDITDVHIGSPGEGYPNRIVLDKVVRWVTERSKEEVVLVLDGDNIEGNLGGFKNRVNRENDLNNESAFRDYLVKSGINRHSEEHDALMREYREWLYYKSPIPSLNTQADLFVDAIKPLVQSGLVRGIIVTDGNHANGTFPGGDVTESGELAQRIEGVAPKHLQGRIRRVYGGRHGGYGEFELEGGLGIAVGHRTEAGTIERLMPKAAISIGGDRHRHRKTVIGERAVLEGMALQGNTGHPDIIGIPTTDSLRGTSLFTVEYGDGGTLLSATDTFISVEFLRKEGLLRVNPWISRFEEERRRINVSPRKITAY